MKQIISNFNSNSQGLCTRFAAIFLQFFRHKKGKKKKYPKIRLQKYNPNSFQSHYDAPRPQFDVFKICRKTSSLRLKMSEDSSKILLPNQKGVFTPLVTSTSLTFLQFPATVI